MSRECERQMDSEYSPEFIKKRKIIIVNALNFTYNVSNLGKGI